ncbi:SET domain-containing protein, partial [Microstroma glucosiphilum]
MCIFECTKACGCSDDCPNRVVQKGRTVPLEVFKTKMCGWGLRTRKALKAGTFITTYAGELITEAETEKRAKVYERHLETSYIYDIEPHMADNIDAGPWGNVSRFLNHSCDPNCGTYYVWTDEVFDVRRPVICFFTRRDVAEGEELTFEY